MEKIWHVYEKETGAFAGSGVTRIENDKYSSTLFAPPSDISKPIEVKNSWDGNTWSSTAAGNPLPTEMYSLILAVPKQHLNSIIEISAHFGWKGNLFPLEMGRDGVVTHHGHQHWASNKWFATMAAGGFIPVEKWADFGLTPEIVADAGKGMAGLDLSPYKAALDALLWSGRRDVKTVEHLDAALSGWGLSVIDG